MSRDERKLVSGVSLGGGGGHSLVSGVPMREQNNDEKGYFFFQAGQHCASFRVGKMLILWKKTSKKVCFFHKSAKTL